MFYKWYFKHRDTEAQRFVSLKLVHQHNIHNPYFASRVPIEYFAMWMIGKTSVCPTTNDIFYSAHRWMTANGINRNFNIFRKRYSKIMPPIDFIPESLILEMLKCPRIPL